MPTIRGTAGVDPVGQAPFSSEAVPPRGKLLRLRLALAYWLAPSLRPAVVVLSAEEHAMFRRAQRQLDGIESYHRDWMIEGQPVLLSPERIMAGKKESA